MKRALFFILSCLTWMACQQKHDGYVIRGEVEGASDGMVYLKAFRNKMFTNVDSVPLANGKFKFQGKVEIPLLYGIAMDKMKYPVQLFLENADMNVTISADGEKIAVAHSPVNDIFLANQEKVFDENYNIDSLVAKYPGSPVAAFFLYRYFTYQLPLEQLKVTRARIAPELNGLVYVKDLDKIIQTLEKVQIGCAAPDFALPDTAGVQVSLSSFKGKYVLLDFWASWCPPCRKENPNVVEAFQKFKDKNFTIVGISLDKSRDAWLKAIRHDQLTWTHLSDLKYWDAAVPALYGIRAIPSNVLIDPEGIIIAKDLREEALHRKLEEILK